MKRLLCFSGFTAITLLFSCQKQQTDAERNAEVERKVQERLAAEHQAQEQEKLSQGQIDLNQRLKDLEAAKANAATASAQQTTESDQDDRSDAASSRDESDNGATATYSTFYTKLEPEGEWRQTSAYGYIWQPRVARESRDWRPYTNGRWVYTDAGWTWISEEPFGWATYHYGRWTRLRNIGWVWVPGNEWAPAWVSWRKSNDYVGWAPLPPEARFERGTGIHNWADNYYDIGPEQYCFVPTNQLGEQRVERAVVPIDRNVTIINQTTNVTNITYQNKIVVNQGPNYDEMRSRSQQPIERLRLERETKVNFEGTDPRPIVRGEVVQMPAPIIARAQAAEKPGRIQETITETVVDHDSDRLGDRQAFEQARLKMKNEATPPPNAPRKVSRRGQLPMENASSAGATPLVRPTTLAQPATPSPAARASIGPTETPDVSPATPTPSMTPFPQRSHPMAPNNTLQRTFPSPSVPLTTGSNQPQASPAGAPTRFGRGAAKEDRKADRQLRREEGSGAQSSATPESSAEPSASATREPSTGSGSMAAPNPSPDQIRQKRGRFQSEALKRNPRIVMPMPSPTPGSASSAGASTASPAATESGPTGQISRKEERKEDRRARRAGGASETASPSPTAP